MFVRVLSFAEETIDGCTLLKGGSSVISPPKNEALNYRRPAFIPGDGWSPLPELSRPITLSDANVAIFSVNNFLSRLNSSGIDLPPLEQNITGTLQVDIGRWLIPVLKPILIHGSNLRPFGIIRHPAGLVTTTRENSGLRTGLHIDSWFGESILGRDMRLSRLTFNLGPGQRFFYAMGPQISARQFPDTFAVGEAVRDILEHPADKQLVRLCLPAGYGYIANTEDLIHDGSTLGSLEHSYTFTLMGHFALDKYPNQTAFGAFPKGV